MFAYKNYFTIQLILPTKKHSILLIESRQAPEGTGNPILISVALTYRNGVSKLLMDLIKILMVIIISNNLTKEQC